MKDKWIHMEGGQNETPLTQPAACLCNLLTLHSIFFTSMKFLLGSVGQYQTPHTMINQMCDTIERDTAQIINGLTHSGSFQ